MKLSVFIAALISLLPVSFASAASSTQPSRPVPQITRALIISIDGCRPDVLLRANAPRIRDMVDHGSFTFWARSTAVCLTLPTHVSMLTGALPEQHAILWNGDLDFKTPVYPRVPTLFELAKKAGYTTALVAGKSKFDILNKPGTIDWGHFPDEAKSNDETVAAAAIEIIHQHKPSVLFVHFPNTDVAGHGKGWDTPEQLAAIAGADKCVGQVLDALAEEKVLDQTVVILTADHGGAGRTHGADDFRSRHIPWIVMGPGIRQNYDLTMNRDLVVDVYDTFPTVCKLLAIPIEKKVAGKYIEDILADRELLKQEAPSNYLPSKGNAEGVKR